MRVQSQELDQEALQAILKTWPSIPYQSLVDPPVTFKPYELDNYSLLDPNY